MHKKLTKSPFTDHFGLQTSEDDGDDLKILYLLAFQSETPMLFVGFYVLLMKDLSVKA